MITTNMDSQTTYQKDSGDIRHIMFDLNKKNRHSRYFPEFNGSNKKVLNKNQYKILLAEDTEMLSQVFEFFLEDLGFTNIDFVCCGEDAYKMFKTNDYSIVFLDICMPPGINGIQTCKKLRSLEKSAHRKNPYVPIIALTSLNDDKTMLKCDEVGFSDYFIKPVLQEDLENIFNYWLGREIKKTYQEVCDDTK